MLWDEPKIFFLERRYFFSIILSEFLKNRVALHLNKADFNRYIRMREMLGAWRAEAAKLEAGEITKEEYDHWRYTYPKVKAERTRDELGRLRGINKTDSAENK